MPCSPSVDGSVSRCPGSSRFFSGEASGALPPPKVHQGDWFSLPASQRALLHPGSVCFCQVDDVSDSQNRILGSVMFWMYGFTGLSECVQVICDRNLFGRLDLQEVTRNQEYGHVSHELILISVALGPQLVFILSASHGSVKQHVLNNGRKKTNLILHHQDFRIP